MQIELGIRAAIYTRNHDRRKAAAIIKDLGFVGVQVASHYSDAPTDPAPAGPGPGALGEDFAKQTRDIFHDAGVQTWVIDCYNDLSSANSEARAQSVQRMLEGLRIARHFGCDGVVTEAGRRDVDGFERFLDSLRQIMPVAEAEDINVCIEPSYAQTVPSAWTMAGAIEEIGSPKLGVLLDPANILVYDSVERMFSELAGRIWCAHAKDCNVDEKGMPSFPSAGQGRVDWHRMIELMLQHGVSRLMIEYANEETAPQVRDFLLGVISDVEGS